MMSIHHLSIRIIRDYSASDSSHGEFFLSFDIKDSYLFTRVGLAKRGLVNKIINVKSFKFPPKADPSKAGNQNIKN